MINSALIKDLERNHLQWVNGFFSPAVIEYPFGKQLITYPGDAGALLWTLDLQKTNWSLDEVINVTRAGAEKWFGEPGFALSDAWGCDRNALEEKLSDAGFENKNTMIWWKHNFQDIKVSESPYEIKPADDPLALANFYHACFQSSEVLAQRVRYQAERPMSKGNDMFLAAYDGDKIIAMIGLAVFNGRGYYHCLGVDPLYRNKGIARALVSKALEQTKQQGASYIYTITHDSNEVSKQLQQSLGYEQVFTKAHWY